MYTKKNKWLITDDSHPTNYYFRALFALHFIEPQISKEKEFISLGIDVCTLSPIPNCPFILRPITNMLF